jgi:hypothetical protein
LAALFRRFAITCTSRVASARTVSDSAGGRRSVSSWRRASTRRPAGLDRVLQHREQVDPLRPELDLALGDAADVEQVVDQVDHLLELALDDVAGALEGLRLVVRRMISSAFLIGASGLRSSWARVARNSSLLRSALRSASSTDLRAVMSTIVRACAPGRRRCDRSRRAPRSSGCCVGPDHAALEVPVALRLQRDLKPSLTISRSSA